MSKFLIAIVTSIFLMTSYIFAADIIVDDNIKLIVNGVDVQSENAPIEVGGIILVPLRPVITKLGVCDDDEHIIWSEEERKVTILKEESSIELKIDSDVGVRNGAEFKLGTPVIIYNSRTYIPLNFIEQTFNKKIVMITDESKVVIRDKEEYLIIKETLDNLNKAVSQIERLKIFINMEVNKEQIDKKSIFIDMDVEAWMDSKHKWGYIMSVTPMFDILINSEIYFEDEVTYTRYQESSETGMVQKGEWEKVSGGDNTFSNMPEKFISMAQLGMDDNMYGIFVIDKEKSNPSTLVIKNELSCKLLIKQLINNQLILGSGDQICEYDLNGIEDIYIEYAIDRETFNPKSMLIKFKIFSGDSDSIQKKAITDIIGINVEFRDINGKFEIVQPK